jgi:hypothetical protein
MTLAANANVLGIQVVNPASALILTGTAYNLNIYGGGIDMSAATQDLTINVSVVKPFADQTWNIASGRTLSILGAINMNAAAVTLTLAGSGTLSIGGNFQIGSIAYPSTVTQTGSTLVSSVAGNIMLLGAYTTGTYNLQGGTIALSANQTIRVATTASTGYTPNGTMNVTGGAITSSGTGTKLIFGWADSVATNAVAAFNQSAGTVSVSEIDFASASLGNIVGAPVVATGALTGGTLNTTTLNVGTLQNGTFTLSNTGVLNLAGTATVGGPTGSVGTMNLNGGTLNFTSTTSTTTIITGATGTVNVNGATISNQATAGSTIITDTVAANMVLGTNGLYVAPALGGATKNWVVLSGNISGNGGVTFDSAGGGTNTGTFELTGSNSFTGGWTIASGYGRTIGDSAIPFGGNVTNNGVWQIGGDATLASLSGTNPSASIADAPGSTNNTITVGYGNASGSYAGVVGGTVNPGTTNLVKIGTGTQTVASGITSLGTTTVQAGTLAVGGAIASPLIVVGVDGSSGAVLDVSSQTAFTVGSGQTLKGVGTVNAGANTVIVNGILAPGDSGLGTLNVSGNLAVLGGTVQFTLASGSNSSVALNGGSVTLDNNAVITLKLALDYTPQLNDEFSLFSGANEIITGAYSFDLSEAILASGLAWNTSNFAETGDVEVVQVPEPQTWASFIGGMGLLLVTLRVIPFRYTKRTDEF